MSGFVRSSHYRHVFVDPPKVENTYKGFRLATVTGEQQYIKGNTKFFAVALQVTPLAARRARQTVRRAAAARSRSCPTARRASSRPARPSSRATSPRSSTSTSTPSTSTSSRRPPRTRPSRCVTRCADVWPRPARVAGLGHPAGRPHGDDHGAARGPARPRAQGDAAAVPPDGEQRARVRVRRLLRQGLGHREGLRGQRHARARAAHPGPRLGLRGQDVGDDVQGQEGAPRRPAGRRRGHGTAGGARGRQVREDDVSGGHGPLPASSDRSVFSREFRLQM